MSQDRWDGGDYIMWGTITLAAVAFGASSAGSSPGASQRRYKRAFLAVDYQHRRADRRAVSLAHRSRLLRNSSI